MSTIQQLFIYSNLITTTTIQYFISSPPNLDTQAVRKFDRLQALIWREALNLEW